MVGKRTLTLSAVVVAGTAGALAMAVSSGGQPIPAPAERHVFVAPSGSDRADGTRSDPWRTLGYAAEQVRPGTTVHVAPGRYRGPLTIERGGTEEQRVRFVSDRRWRAQISASSGGSLTVVEIRGDHVTFEGFEVSGRGDDGSATIDLEGSDDAAVRNHVAYLDAPCLSDGDGAAGILIGGGSGDYRNSGGLVDGNLVERVGDAPRDGSCRLAHGIYAAVPGVRMVNNIVTLAAGDGITSWHAASSLTIANNLSLRNGGAGILIGSGDSAAPPTGNTDSLVANNIVDDNALAGIIESSDGEHPVGPGNRYMNNLVNGDPRLSGGTAVPGRYRPLPCSPAIDGGTSVGAPDDDFDGTRRPRGGGVDIGPFELTPWRAASARSSGSPRRARGSAAS